MLREGDGGWEIGRGATRWGECVNVCACIVILPHK